MLPSSNQVCPSGQPTISTKPQPLTGKQLALQDGRIAAALGLPQHEDMDQHAEQQEDGGQAVGDSQ
jgi:hypothetical protein